MLLLTKSGATKSNGNDSMNFVSLLRRVFSRIPIVCCILICKTFFSRSLTQDLKYNRLNSSSSSDNVAIFSVTSVTVLLASSSIASLSLGWSVPFFCWILHTSDSTVYWIECPFSVCTVFPEIRPKEKKYSIRKRIVYYNYPITNLMQGIKRTSDSATCCGPTFSPIDSRWSIKWTNFSAKKWTFFTSISSRFFVASTAKKNIDLHPFFFKKSSNSCENMKE